MENQHRKITGYRDLSQAEIDLMNRIKSAGAQLLTLHAEVLQHLQAKEKSIMAAMSSTEAESDSEKQAQAEYDRFWSAEPRRWAAIAKTDVQTGVMALVRAVAQPTDC